MIARKVTGRLLAKDVATGVYINLLVSYEGEEVFTLAKITQVSRKNGTFRIRYLDGLRHLQRVFCIHMQEDKTGIRKTMLILPEGAVKTVLKKGIKNVKEKIRRAHIRLGAQIQSHRSRQGAMEKFLATC